MRPPRRRTASGRGLLVRRVDPPFTPYASPRPHRASETRAAGRSAPRPACDEAGVALVRPYFLAHEHRGAPEPEPAREQPRVCEERRRALALALDGIDIGPWVIHGHRIGTPAIPGMAVLGMGTAA